MSQGNQPAGWYPAQGDPAGTVRWWDGSQWVGGPQQQGAQQQDGYVVPGGGGLPNGRELADPWMRIAAAVIDAIFLFFITFLVSLVTGGGALALDAFGDGGGIDLTSSEFVVAGLISTLIVAAYHTLMNTYMSGGVGKQALGLRIVRADGTEPLGTPDGIKRSGNHLLDIVGVIPIIGTIVVGLAQLVINLVSLVFLFTDPEHRTVMDRFANTYVVTKQR